jgi:hypothetical protein
MKNLLLMIVLVYATVMVTVLLLSGSLLNQDVKKHPVTAGSNQPIQIGEAVYYIAVVSKNIKYNDIPLRSLESAKIVSDEKNIGQLQVSLTNVTYVKSEEIPSFLNNGYIGVIRPFQLKDEYKVITVDGQDYYDETMDKASYPLVFIDYLQ